MEMHIYTEAEVAINLIQKCITSVHELDLWLLDDSNDYI